MTNTPKTSTKQKELQDFRATLSEHDQKILDREIEEKGADEVAAHLEFYKNQMEYVNSIF